MKTVMIADDEVLVRLGLQTLIPWEDHGYHLSGVFKNGQEAWDAVRTNPPDVLLTDIKMPIMDGLELAERVVKEFKTTNVIILSSYEEREYLRRSIKIGVKDFIPKYELNPADFLNTLDQLPYAKSMHMHVEQETNESAETEKKTLLELTAPCRAGTQGDLLPERFPSLYGKGKQLETTHYAWLVLQPWEQPAGISEPRMRAFEFQVEEILQTNNKTDYLGGDGQFLHILLYSRESEAQAQAALLAVELQNEARRSLNMELAVGFSRETSRFMFLGKLREQALIACQQSFYGGPGLQEFSPDLMLYEFGDDEWKSKQTAIRKYLDEKEYKKLEKWLENELNVAEKKALRPSDAIQLCHLACRQLIEHMQEQESNLLQEEDRELLNLLENSDRVMLSMISLKSQTLSFIHDKLAALQQWHRTSPWIANILNIIHNSYDQPLRLEELAEQSNFSASYLSQRFQMEVKMSFSEYLAKTRIQKAMDLLRNSHLSTEEISLRVGYINPNYFVKVFKKVTGQTVTAFKNVENRGGRNASEN